MDKEIYDEIDKLLRAQRHEFINHLQVIHAMIEIGQTAKALKYIEELAKAPDIINRED